MRIAAFESVASCSMVAPEMMVTPLRRAHVRSFAISDWEPGPPSRGMDVAGQTTVRCDAPSPAVSEGAEISAR